MALESGYYSSLRAAAGTPGPFDQDPDQQQNPGVFSGPTNNAPANNALPRDASFRRGLSSAVLQSSLGSYAEEANQAERDNDPERLAQIRSEQSRLRGYLEEDKPRVAQLSDIHDIGDAFDYAAQLTGSLTAQIPPVAAGITAGVALAPAAVPAYVASGLGAGAVMYKQGKQSTMAAQEQDPAIMARDPLERERAAQASGLVAGALGAIPVGRVVAGAVPKNLALRAATGGAEGAAANVGTSLAEQASLGALNPERDTSHDTAALTEAAVTGGVLGVAGAGRAPEKEAAKPGTELAPQTEPTSRWGGLYEKAQKAGSAAGRFKDWAADVFGGDKREQAVDELNLGDENPDLRGNTPEQTAENIRASDERRMFTATALAEEMLNDPDTAPNIRETIAGFDGDYSTPEAQRFLGSIAKHQMLGEKVGKSVRSMIDDLKSVLKKGTTILKEGTKQNLEDSAGYVRAEDIVFNGLKPELQSDPIVLKQHKELARLLADLTARGNAIDNSALKTFGGFAALDELFTDPTTVLNDIAASVGVESLSGRFKTFSAALEDAKAGGGRLFQALPPDRQNSITTGQLRELAKFIDHIAMGGKMEGDPLAVLTEVYGDEVRAQHVLDYYERRAKAADVYEKETEAESDIQERDIPKNYAFQRTASGGDRPFHSSELELARKQAKAELQPGQSPRMINMAEFAKREGRSPVELLSSILKDIQGRIDIHAKRLKDEPQRQEQIDRLNKQLASVKEVMDEVKKDPMLADLPADVLADYAAQKGLSKFHVAELLGEKGRELLADDRFISESRTGLKAKNRDVTEEVIFTKTDGTELKLHGPSMVRAMGIRQGSGQGEAGSARAARLFNDAVSSVLGRDDITGIKTKPEDVKITGNRTLGEIDQPKYRGATEPETTVPRTELEKSLDIPEGGDKFDALRDYAAEDASNPLIVSESIDEAEASIHKRQENARYAINLVKQTLQRVADKKPFNRDVLRGIGDTVGEVKAWLARQERIDLFRRGELDLYDELKRDLHEIVRDQQGGMTDIAEMREQEAGVGPRSVTESQGPTRRETSKGETASGYAERNSGTTQVGDATDEQVHKQNAQDPTGARMTDEEAAKIREEIARMRGPEVKVVLDQFAKDIGASADYLYSNGERIIRVALDAAMPLSKAYHEAMHDFMATLMKDPYSRKFKQDMLDAMKSPSILKQLKELLSKDSKAHDAMMADPEERLAYAFQFWASGQLRVGPNTETLFGKIMKFVRGVLGIVSRDEKIEKVMRAMYTGKLSEPDAAMVALKDLHISTLADKAKALSGPIGEAMGKMATASTDRLRQTGIEALKKIADGFHREAEHETGELGFLQNRSRQDATFVNEFQNVMEGANNVEARELLLDMQSMKTPVTAREKKMAALLEKLHDYMKEAGVKTFHKGSETDIGYVEKYFPRVWDRAYIREYEAEFRILFRKYMSADAVEELFQSVTSGAGTLDLAETASDIGFTPWNQSLKDRKLSFINESNAAEFIKFQEKDLGKLMGTYIKQATHRAEYARSWGNRGEKLKGLMAQAKQQGASAEELTMAGKAVQAMEGTLGYDMNPRLRGLFTGLQQLQNVVLLPFALFSSLIDPMGVAMRSGEAGEAFKAFKTGVDGIWKSMTNRYKDGDYELARTMGIISDGSMMDALGSAYEAQYGWSFMRKMNAAMFKFNGMERWNQSMRIAAMRGGMRFLLRNVSDPGIHSERWLKELGVEAGDVQEMPNGHIKTSQADGLTAEQEKRIQKGLYSFVDSAIIRPNAAHRPIWGSDPHWSLIFHLKQFTFSMQNVILRRVRHEFENGNTQAAITLASYVPMMIAADLLKAGLTGTVHTNWGLTDYIAHGVSRSGVLGVGTFGVDALMDPSMGNAPGASLVGPTGAHALMIGETLSGRKSLTDLLLRSTPAAGVVKMFAG